MKIPGSDGFKVHDVSMKLQSLNHIKVNLNDIYSHYQNLLTKNEISSVSFDVFDSSNGYKNYDKDIAYNDIALLTSNDDTTCEQFNLSHTSVTIQTCVDFNNLVDILGERGQGTSIECKRPFHLEVDCLSLTSLTFDDTPDSVAVQGINSIRGLDFCISEQQLSDQFKLRVNLYLDITSILHGHVDKASKPAPSPLSVMSAVGHLCDLREVEVVTLVLCSALPLSTLLAGQCCLFVMFIILSLIILLTACHRRLSVLVDRRPGRVRAGGARGMHRTGRGGHRGRGPSGTAGVATAGE
jgi:hypothetical protein